MIGLVEPEVGTETEADGFLGVQGTSGGRVPKGVTRTPGGDLEGSNGGTPAGMNGRTPPSMVGRISSMITSDTKEQVLENWILNRKPAILRSQHQAQEQAITNTNQVNHC